MEHFHLSMRRHLDLRPNLPHRSHPNLQPPLLEHKSRRNLRRRFASRHPTCAMQQVLAQAPPRNLLLYPRPRRPPLRPPKPPFHPRIPQHRHRPPRARASPKPHLKPPIHPPHQLQLFLRIRRAARLDKLPFNDPFSRISRQTIQRIHIASRPTRSLTPNIVARPTRRTLRPHGPPAHVSKRRVHSRRHRHRSPALAHI